MASRSTWTSVDTVRCTRCRVFTPTDDILYTTSGDPYCTTCGAPPVSIRPPASPVAVSAGRLKKNPFVVAAAAVAAVIASSFIAACASQL